MKKIFLFTLVIGLLIISNSCQEEYEVGDAGAKTLSGDWVVIEYSLDVEALYGPYTLQVYNTSFDPDMIWIENIYDSGYKVKANKLSDTTFGVSGATDVTGGHDGTMDIVDGEVFDNDSISFRVILYDADGEIADDYLEAGHRYTGWADDQH